MSGYTFSFQLAEYLLKRGDARVYDWKTLNDNAKYFSDVRRAAMENWGNKAIDIRTDDVAFTMRRKEVMRMAVLKVLAAERHRRVREPAAARPAGQDRATGRRWRRRRLPGMATARGSASRRYSCRPASPTRFTTRPSSSVPTARSTSRCRERPRRSPTGPLPFNIAFWAGPGDEAVVLKVASAYEAATHHRKPPAGFGPVQGQRQSSVR